MNISVRIEGGIGDHLLSNRFIPAIKEKYPDSKIYAYSDPSNVGSSIPANVIWENFQDFYENITIIPEKRFSDFKGDFGFGEENYPSHLDNIPIDYFKQMTSYDLFFDLQIDSLGWSNLQIPWQKYFFSFPNPSRIAKKKSKNKSSILCHLFSRKDSPYLMEGWYVKALTKDLSKNFDEILLIADPNNEDSIDFYKEFAYKAKNVSIIKPFINEVFDLCRNSSAFIGIDSGLRYIPYHFGVPTFLFTSSCRELGRVAPSHLVRWVIFEKQAIPLHYASNEVISILKNAIENKLFSIFPSIQSFDNVKRSVVFRNL